jgi:membrane protease YdiL (CAAX protease family)
MEPIDEEPESAPPPAAGFVRLGLLLYGTMMAAALIWRVGVYGEPIVFASEAAAARGIDWPRDLGLGLGCGLGVVALSALLTRATSWGDALARALAETLGGLGLADALLLAFASGLGEELFFRGALQPRVGLIAASLLFGIVHFIPRREFLPWTGFAIACGFMLGVLFAATGNLVAPVTAHVVINGINLPLLARQYGEAAAGDGA